MMNGGGKVKILVELMVLFLFVMLKVTTKDGLEIIGLVLWNKFQVVILGRAPELL